MDQIIIKQSYFDNIKIAVDGINQFFESGFTVKNFPVDSEDLDWAVGNIVELMEDLDPVYVSDNAKMSEVVDDIHTKLDENPDKSTDEILSDRQMNSALSSVISYSSLQQIADHFDEFSTFINAVYTFDLFMNPSKYSKEIELFSSDVQLPYELDGLDLDVSLFSVESYVNALMNNPSIQFPSSFNTDTEVQRILQFRDLKNSEVVVDNTNTGTDNVAEFSVDLVDNIISSKNVRYDKATGKFQTSKQYNRWVDWIVESLRECVTSYDVLEFFGKPPDMDPKFQDFCVPRILAEAYTNPEKCSLYLSDYDMIPPACEYLCESVYTESDRRFANYDIFDTFRTDKDATIQFIEDFLKLRFVNEYDSAIRNDLLLDIFTEYDAACYFQSLYDIKKRYATKEEVQDFVNSNTRRIIQNSHSINRYKPSTEYFIGESFYTSENETNSIYKRMKAFEDIDPEDCTVCESVKDLLYDEIKLVPDRVYNRKASPFVIDKFIGESYEYIMESRDRPYAKGEIPDYMKTRMELSDKDSKSEATPVPDPVMAPANSIDDLADSINDKMTMDGPMDSVMGSGFEQNPEKKDGQHVVYNITYNNSFNRNDLSTHNDLSTKNDLSSHSTHNDLSSRHTDSHNVGSVGRDYGNNVRLRQPDSKPVSESWKNNNYNSDDSLDSTESSNALHDFERVCLSNGHTIQEMFAFLESEEPLSNELGTTPERFMEAEESLSATMNRKPPKHDSLVSAMDRDRKSRGKLQEADRKLQKFGNTVRATFKPIDRTKKWLTNVVNSLVERDENKVKEEIIENPSYRTALYKALRLAVKLGLTGIAFTISGWLGAGVVAYEAGRVADKNRMRREVQDEMVTELKIMDEKIARAKETGNQEELYHLIRLRGKMESIAADSARGRWKGMQKENWKYR